MKILALILCIANLGMTLVSGFMAMFSPMAMDAPGSEKITSLKVFVYLMFASPLVFLITDALAWMRYSKGNYAAASTVAALGWLPFLIAILALFFTSTGSQH
ncbi:MAG: hypothetical protein IT258_00160 [Saprospiraceae bacterium]|nr:hypothetical protein [Saprospiraceae bacterium]